MTETGSSASDACIPETNSQSRAVPSASRRAMNSIRGNVNRSCAVLSEKTQLHIASGASRAQRAAAERIAQSGKGVGRRSTASCPRCYHSPGLTAFLDSSPTCFSFCATLTTNPGQLCPTPRSGSRVESSPLYKPSILRHPQLTQSSP